MWKIPTAVFPLQMHRQSVLAIKKLPGESIVLFYALVLTGCEGWNKTPTFALLNYSSLHRIHFHTSQS